MRQKNYLSGLKTLRMNRLLPVLLCLLVTCPAVADVNESRHSGMLSYEFRVQIAHSDTNEEYPLQVIPEPETAQQEIKDLQPEKPKHSIGRTAKDEFLISGLVVGCLIVLILIALVMRRKRK